MDEETSSAWHEIVRDVLKRHQVKLVTYVPDNVLRPLIDGVHADPFFTAFSCAREEEAVGIVSGAWMGGLRGIVLMQTSGFATLPNAIASLAVPFQIPVLMMVSDLWPKYSFNAYGAAETLIAREHDLLRDTIAAMIEANRTVYTDKQKVIPAIVEATQKPADAVAFAIDVITKGCMLSVNSGFVRERTEWTHQNNIDIGDIPPEKKLTFDQIADHRLAEEAVASLGGPVTIDTCKD